MGTMKELQSTTKVQKKEETASVGAGMIKRLAVESSKFARGSHNKVRCCDAVGSSTQ